MAARKFAEAALEKASARSIFIRAEPKPRNLAERRAILRAVQEFGEIEVFKQLRHPSSFVSVTARKSTADELVERSPLQFDYIREGPATVGSLKEAFPRGLRTPNIAMAANPAQKSSNGRADREAGVVGTRKAFALHVFPSPEYKHRTAIRHSPLHGPWPMDEGVEQTFTHAALSWSVPKGCDADGLRDWQSGGQLDESDLLGYSADDQKLALINRRKARSAAAEAENADLKETLKLLKSSQGSEAANEDTVR